MSSRVFSPPFVASRFVPLPLVALLGVTLLLAAAAPAPAQELTRQEYALVDWVDRNVDGAIALLEETVNINSGTMNHAGVREVAEVMRPKLEALGLEVEWIELPPEVDRAGHLFARTIDGTRGRKLLLIGHLDTVFEEDDPFQEFRRIGEGWATGPGIADMKSGNVIILYALEALHEAGLLEGAQITVAYTGDEESPGDPLSISRRDLVDAGEWADVALGFEGGVRDDEAEWATIARRSSSGWRLEVEGRQAHSSGVFSEGTGAGAIFEASRILNGFYDEVKGPENLTFNAGVILGGTEVDYDPQANRGTAFGKTNVVPSRVVVDGGIRTLTNEQLADARRAMEGVVSRHLPRTSARITFSDGYPAMPPTDGNRALQEMLSDINVALGREPMPALDPARRGAADIAFVAPYVDGLAGVGAYGRGGHSPDEALGLNTMSLAIKRAAILIHRLVEAGPAS